MFARLQRCCRPSERWPRVTRDVNTGCQSALESVSVSHDSARDNLLRMATHGLALLASDFAQQSRAFPEFVSLGSELIRSVSDPLDMFEAFGDSAEARNPSWSAIQLLVAWFGSRTHRVPANWWERPSVESDPVWQEIRIEARRVCGELEIDWQSLGDLPSNDLFIPGR